MTTTAQDPRSSPSLSFNHSFYKSTSSSSDLTSQFKFPDLTEEPSDLSQNTSATFQTSSNTFDQYLNSSRESRRDDRRRSHSFMNGGSRHGRQKSLSDTLNKIRNRSGSVSANAQEIADALKAPVSFRLILLCLVWYMSSALTNTSSKSILNAFSKPVTLTIVQFANVSCWCLFFSFLGQRYPAVRRAIPALKNGVRYPSREVITTTLPLAIFQVGGHILSSTATSKIPVSLVHTVKGLSPLFTVLAYRIVYRIHYGANTYLSLIPLTIGVMLACSGKSLRGDFVGIACAVLATLVFVSQNIFSKKLFNQAARAEADGYFYRSKALDKLNLLCYSTALAFLLTVPVWLLSEGFSILGDFFQDGSISLDSNIGALDHGRLAVEFFFNGVFHFGQSIIAFTLLSMVSPVTYSVASLIKRVFVVVVAIVWFGSRTTTVQASGIALTFVGLYLYDRTSDADKADRRAKLAQFKAEGSLLPLANGHVKHSETRAESYHPVSDEKKSDDRPSMGKAHGQESLDGVKGGWLPPGTKQEETWRPTDMRNDHRVSVL